MVEQKSKERVKKPVDAYRRDCTARWRRSCPGGVRTATEEGEAKASGVPCWRCSMYRELQCAAEAERCCVEVAR